MRATERRQRADLDRMRTCAINARVKQMKALPDSVVLQNLDNPDFLPIEDEPEPLPCITRQKIDRARELSRQVAILRDAQREQGWRD